MQPRAGAFVLVAIVVASGCVGEIPSPTPGPSLAPGASILTPATSAPSRPATDSPTLPPGEPLVLTVDPSLEASLPATIGAARFTRHTLHTGEAAPSGFSNDLGRSLLASTGKKSGAISVAWLEIVPEQAEAAAGMTIVAIRIPGADARWLRYLVVADRLLKPGATGSIAGSRNDGHKFLFGGDALVMSAVDTVYVMTSPRFDASASPAPSSATPIQISEEELLSAFPPLDEDPPSGPMRSLPPVPSADPDVSPEPALAAEALLPDRIDDAVVRKVSARGADLTRGAMIYVGLPMYSLYTGGLDIDPTTIEAAGANPQDRSTFWVVATSVPGHDARSILGAWFVRQIDADLVETFETIDVDGSLAVLHGNNAVRAVDGVLYWMTYLDVGDSFGATQPPRPPLRDLVVETLRALP